MEGSVAANNFLLHMMISLDVVIIWLEIKVDVTK